MFEVLTLTNYLLKSLGLVTKPAYCLCGRRNCRLKWGSLRFCKQFILEDIDVVFAAMFVRDGNV